MEEEIEKVEADVKKAWPRVMAWVGGASAVIGLIATLAGGVSWFASHHKGSTEREAKMALAQAQANQGEYQASVDSYGAILKADPLYRPALDGQLSATMLWAENFSVVAKDGQSANDLAAPELDEMMAILDAGLTRAKGAQLADVQAHIGWVHLLNQQIAGREFGDAAEQNFRAALTTDPSNVYANAMLGNWLLQNRGSFTEAIEHLNNAVKSGKARPFVRTMQLDGLIQLEREGARGEVVKAANDMRKSGEPLDAEFKSRIVTFCFDPVVTDRKELAESLTAVPADEAWQTYLWLDEGSGNSQDRTVAHEFVQANLLELSGKRQESQDAYRALQQKLKDNPGSMKSSVDAAVARVSQK